MFFRSPIIKRASSILLTYESALNRVGTCYKLRWSSTSTTRHDPLHVLFCGADEISIYSLRALHALQQKEAGLVKSIDVVCRPDKRTGRSLKTIRQVPIKSIANELGLQLHQLDTFTGWNPPNPVDLIVTVSFGLLVPSRLLNAATFGGINLHPSLLPDLKGPAPIQHALLKQRQYTGVSIQTMHPKTFDAGVVLAQTPQPGLKVPRTATVDELIAKLGPLGAEMLVRSIREGLFVPPTTATTTSTASHPGELFHAPKITPEDRHIDWSSWNPLEIALRDRVIGRLWDDTVHAHIERLSGNPIDDQRTPATAVSTRTTFQGPWREIRVADERTSSLLAGTPFLYTDGDSDNPERLGLGVMCAAGKAVAPTSATIASGKAGQGMASLIRQLRDAGHEVYRASSLALQ